MGHSITAALTCTATFGLAIASSAAFRATIIAPCGSIAPALPGVALTPTLAGSVLGAGVSFTATLTAPSGGIAIAPPGLALTPALASGILGMSASFAAARRLPL
ncbi:hypothetical protein [Halorhodospira halophila]|uniref:hypothetical protein n=1 Tax=Halorhodospira halophila TaxID=1053 RepID=UPI001A915331|nr:hypothetical protein [Halorhodospira halophila]